ncbi:MAG TPA: response regulator [Terriglobales bacterium]|nr:response regulator [Terriglobales bacterium]
MSKRILFVDDEPMLLSGLKRSLYPLRQEWEMVFVNSGKEALDAMSQHPFDIIVTDMLMPEMSGAQLLEEVKARFPQTLRMVLSGQADQELILKSVDPTHQYISKPCEADELKRRLMRAFAIRDLLQSSELRGLVSRLDSLPSLPSLYFELTGELNKSEPSVARIGKLVSADVGMTSKILQLVNSAFFGVRCQISNAMQAVQLLGLDVLRALILSTHVFSSFRTTLFSDADLQCLWKHNLSSSSYARSIAVSEGIGQRGVDDCFTAALLHDSGKMVLASVVESNYQHVLQLVKSTGASIVSAEKEVLGCTHAEVAAYLFGMWGLPDSIVEGVAWHHKPSDSGQSTFSTVAATHVASIYDELHSPNWLLDHIELDRTFLETIGCAAHEEKWRSLTAPAEPNHVPAIVTE